MDAFPRTIKFLFFISRFPCSTTSLRSERKFPNAPPFFILCASTRINSDLMVLTLIHHIA